MALRITDGKPQRHHVLRDSWVRLVKPNSERPDGGERFAEAVADLVGDAGEAEIPAEGHPQTGEIVEAVERETERWPGRRDAGKVGAIGTRENRVSSGGGGHVPTRPGSRGWRTLSVHGPMGRTVAAVAAALSVLAGPDGSDLSSIPAAGPPFGLPLDGLDYLSGLRVAFSWDLGFARVADEVRDGFGEALSTIGALGVRLHEAHPTVSEDVVALWLSIGDPERHASEGPLLSRAEEMTERSVRALRRGEGTSARDYLDAQHRREEFSREWEDFLTEFDVLVYPGEPILPFALDESDRIHAETTFWEMDMVANLTKQPAVSLPCGMSNGLPVGLQVLARRHGDAKLLRAAAAIERHLSAPSLRDSWS